MEKNKIIVVELKVIGWCFLIIGLTHIIGSLMSRSLSGNIDILLGPLEAVAGFGILRLQEWGRRFGIATCVIGIAVIVWAEFNFDRQNSAILRNICMSLPIFVFVTYTLCHNKAKELFK